MRRTTRCGGYASFLGAGVYRHYKPVIIDSLVQRGEFLTSYTPYQPEIAQGTLQAMFEFQTMICELTGMEIANASACMTEVDRRGRGDHDGGACDRAQRRGGGADGASGVSRGDPDLCAAPGDSADRGGLCKANGARDLHAGAR